MRRQAGVDAVDIDTRKSTCTVGYETAKSLDFIDIEDAAEDANYVLIGIGIRAHGKVVQGHCDACDDDVYYLQFRGSKQRLELSEQAKLGAASLKGDVLDWASDHPRLQVEKPE